MQAVNLHGMNYRDIPLQLVSKGFRVAEVPIVNRVRIGGTSNFNFMNRLIGGTVDFLAAVFMSLMGDAPFRLWGGLGISLGVAGAGGLCPPETRCAITRVVAWPGRNNTTR